MSTPIKSTDHDALNAAFAEKVAGWVPYAAPTCNGSLMLPYRWFDGAGYPQVDIKDFTHSADAVLPWLEKWHLPRAYFRDGMWGCIIGEGTVIFSGAGKSLPHAGVIALLRAHGVEVVD